MTLPVIAPPPRPAASVTSASAPRRGRPPGDQNTRARVLAAARRTFTERGYDAATLRHIAREAGVDAGMVRHYFVDKAGLFRAAMELPIDPGAVLVVAALRGAGKPG